MSSRARETEKALEWEQELIRIENEQIRKRALPMWERIEELDASYDLKDILHRLANGERE